MSGQRAERRASVWVVDDNRHDAEAARRALASVADVRILYDGSDVLERLSRHSPPDVLVLDWVMPGVSGIEVVRFLRAEGNMPQVPVLLLTAHHAPEQIVEGLSAGANDFLSKPFHDEELRARVDALLRSAALLKRAVQAERALQNLLANAPDVLLGIDARGRVLYANHEASVVFGEPVESLLGRPLLSLVPDFPQRNINLDTGNALFPLPEVHVGDRTFVPSVRVVPDDTAAKTTVALRDVTDRKGLERRRLDFYSIIAHDLRAPLQTIMLRTEAILRGHRGHLSSEVLTDVSMVERNVRSMVALINDFLELARFEGTGLKVDDEPLDLRALASATIHDLRPLAESKRQTLELKAGRPQVPVRGDRARLAQVFANLLGNALKFTPPDGTIWIELELEGASVRARVCDNGPGIPVETLAHVFERFKRMPSHQHIIGSGLGLTIVREIVEAHGGQVGVHSEEGKGSCFWFELPALTQGSAPR